MTYLNYPSTTYTNLDRAIETFNIAKANLLEDLETVELVETAPGRWVIAFYDIEDGALIHIL